MVHPSAKYNSEDNLLEDVKPFSRVNQTEKPFKDSLGYPSNPQNLLNPSNPPSPSHPLNPSLHRPNPCFKDSHQRCCYNISHHKLINPANIEINHDTNKYYWH